MAGIIQVREAGPVHGKPGLVGRRLDVIDPMLHGAHLFGSLRELTRFPGSEELGDRDCPWGGNTE